jgi:hypothetical protein
MITDYGLNNQPILNPRPYLNGNNRTTFGFNYLAVGTSSATPSPTQTNLGAEVARTVSNGGATESGSDYYDANLNALVSKGYLVREIEFSASYNLTEFGFFSGSSGANCMYRQLFREDPNDPNSNPVVISVQSGDRIRVRYTVSWIVPLSVLGPISVTVNGVQANMKVFVGIPNTPLAYRFHPHYLPESIGGFRVSANSYYTYDNSTPVTSVPNSSYYDVNYMYKSKQISGTTVTNTITMIASVAFTNRQTVFFFDSTQNQPYYCLLVFAFDTPISKTDLQEMTFTFTYSWGRA